MMNAKPERDVELKLRMMRYLWHLGYYVRRNVGIVEYWEGGGQYTDVDVLGIKIDEELNYRLIACDCKSGERVRIRERLFWLSGVMKYLGIDQGFFIRTKPMGDKHVELASSLGILPLSISQLESLEKSYKTSSESYGPFCKEYSQGDAIFSVLRQFSAPAADYILARYWEDPPHQQISSLVSRCKEIKEMNGLETQARSFLLCYMLSLLSLAMLRFSRQVLAVPDKEKEDFIKLGLFGGKLKFKEQKSMLGAFYDFMTREIEERYGKRYPLSRSQFIDGLIPEYSKYFVDVVKRISLNPGYSICVPRIFDLIAFESILNGRKINILQALEGIPSAPQSAIDAVSNFYTFAERSKLTTDDLSKTFKTFLKSE